MPSDIEGMSSKPTIEKSRKVYISRKWKSSAFRKCMVSYTSLKQLFGYISAVSHNFIKFWNITWYVFPLRYSNAHGFVKAKSHNFPMRV